MSIQLDDTYGFTDADEQTAFNQIPNIVLQRTISGPLLIDTPYRLNLTDTIVDAGQGVNDTTSKFAVTGATGDPAKVWGPDTRVSGVTIFGRMRAESATGSGGIWVHALEIQDTQRGCIKFSYFSGEAADRLGADIAQHLILDRDFPGRLRQALLPWLFAPKPRGAGDRTRLCIGAPRGTWRSADQA